MRNPFSSKPTATDVLSREVPAFDVNTDARSHTRLGWWVILLGMGGFLVWATYAPLDKGVPLSATVTVSGNKKAVQHLIGGTVESILVKEGDTVKAGDVLVRMNAVQVKVNAELARGQYISARTTEARLMAERDDKKAIVFPPMLASLKDDPRIASHISLQQQLFSSRQNAIFNELAAVDENMAGLKQQNKGLEESREGKKQQLVLLKEQLNGTRDLANEGFVPRNRLLELERTYSQLNTAISEDSSSIERVLRQIAELKLRRMQRKQEYQKEVRTQLAEVQKEAEGLANRLTGLDYDLGNALVRSPADGVVAAMNVFTHGGVIAPGFRMMDIVPIDEPLIVDGQLPVHLVDKVHPNLKVELMFTAFNQNLTPHIPGIVTQVSADRLVDEKSGMPYYALRAKVAPEGMKLLANLQVRPGMPVDLFIKTGERTMMNYLLKPVFDHLKMSMTEE
jgi:membrane fusion protein, protease secretion system